MSIAVTVAAKAAAEAAKQKYDEDDKENESKRHGLISRRLAAINTITVNPRNRKGCAKLLTLKRSVDLSTCRRERDLIGAARCPILYRHCQSAGPKLVASITG